MFSLEHSEFLGSFGHSQGIHCWQDTLCSRSMCTKAPHSAVLLFAIQPILGVALGALTHAKESFELFRFRPRDFTMCAYLVETES